MVEHHYIEGLGHVPNSPPNKEWFWAFWLLTVLVQPLVHSPQGLPFHAHKTRICDLLSLLQEDKINRDTNHPIQVQVEGEEDENEDASGGAFGSCDDIDKLSIWS